MTWKQLAAGEVRRPEDLAEVPHAAALVLGLLHGEFLCAVGEVAAEDDRVRPDVADQVGGQVAGEDPRRERAGQQREGDVVLQRLAPDLLPDARQGLALVGDRDLTGADALGLHLVQRDAVLEQHHQQERVDRVAQEVRLPPLVLAHPQDAVADVAVHADDVGVGVVHVVVRVAPLVAGAGRVPFEVAAGQRGIAHPVVLAVHDVVADLHVVEDLRQPPASRCPRSTRAAGCRRTAARGRRPRVPAAP